MIFGAVGLGAAACCSTSMLTEGVRWVGEISGHPAPVVPAPLADPLRGEPAFAAPSAPTAAGRRVIDTLAEIETRTERTRYQHATHVRPERGEYFWDCSGMVSWVLARAAPRARRGLGRRRPRAMHYYRTIARAPTDAPRRGWQRIEHIRDVRPGDVFAWESPRRFRHLATGHVGFVVRQPRRIRDALWAVRIVDSTIPGHQDDARGLSGAGGSGEGTMTFMTDGGRAIAYGWHGTASFAYVESPVVFGRVH